MALAIVDPFFDEDSSSDDDGAMPQNSTIRVASLYGRNRAPLTDEEIYALYEDFHAECDRNATVEHQQIGDELTDSEDEQLSNMLPNIVQSDDREEQYTDEDLRLAKRSSDLEAVVRSKINEKAPTIDDASIIVATTSFGVSSTHGIGRSTGSSSSQGPIIVPDRRRPAPETSGTNWLGAPIHPKAPLIGRATPMTAYGPVDMPVQPTLPTPVQRWACSCPPERNPTIEGWMFVLRYQFRCDPDCLDFFWDFGHRGPREREHANMIIGKVFKRVNDDIQIECWSAFITKCIRHAEDDIERERQGITMH